MFCSPICFLLFVTLAGGVSYHWIVTLYKLFSVISMLLMCSQLINYIVRMLMSKYGCIVGIQLSLVVTVFLQDTKDATEPIFNMPYQFSHAKGIYSLIYAFLTLPLRSKKKSREVYHIKTCFPIWFSTITCYVICKE